MNGDEARTAARLDEYLDAVVAGRGQAPDGLNPALLATVDRVHAQGTASAPDTAFGDRLWQRLTDRPPVENSTRAPVGARMGRALAGAPARRRTDRVLRVWGTNPLANVATGALLVLTLAVGYAAARGVAPGPVGEAALAYELYVSEDRNGRRFIQLDPMTLVRRDGTPPLEDGEAWWGVTSGDGSTLVSILEPEGGASPWAPVEEVTIVVRDGRTGVERTRFHPAMLPAISPRLSHDGTRLVVQTIPMASGPPDAAETPVDVPPTWHVYDTADGRLLATVPHEQWRESYAIDRAGRHVYQLQVSVVSRDPAELTGPRPAQLIVTELASDGQTKQLTLPDVMSGYWATDRILRGSPATGFFAPALARSPDGPRLAIVHADEDVVTIVDAERLTVERTIRLARSEALRDRLFALLPLVPREARAKQAAIGTELRAVFGPDGRHLYVTGTDTVINAVGRLELRSRGLRVVDLGRGEIVAELSPDLWGRNYAPDPLVAPDGQSIYVEIPKYPERRNTSAYLLRRLDATTLETLAEREVWNWTSILLKPVRPESSVPYPSAA